MFVIRFRVFSFSPTRFIVIRKCHQWEVKISLGVRVKPSTHWDPLSRTLVPRLHLGFIYCVRDSPQQWILHLVCCVLVFSESHLKWDSFTQCRATLSQCVRESRHRDISLQLCYNFHYYFFFSFLLFCCLCVSFCFSVDNVDIRFHYSLNWGLSNAAMLMRCDLQWL